MRVELRLFANLARYLPAGAQGNAVTLELPEGATLAALERRLGIPPELPRLTLVNGHDAAPDQPLVAGDVVSIVPPLEGGSPLGASGCGAPARRLTGRAPPPSLHDHDRG